MATYALSSSIPPGAFAGAGVIARPCIVAPVFLTANVTFARVHGRLVGLDPHLAGPATFGAPVVCRMPAAPLTMSPNACVRNGGEPTGDVRELVERLRAHVRIWIR